MIIPVRFGRGAITLQVEACHVLIPGYDWCTDAWAYNVIDAKGAVYEGHWAIAESHGVRLDGIPPEAHPRTFPRSIEAAVQGVKTLWDQHRLTKQTYDKLINGMLTKWASEDLAHLS